VTTDIQPSLKQNEKATVKKVAFFIPFSETFHTALAWCCLQDY